ncbi:MAG TPA: hypothetical protein PKC21_03425 [Oligoflexia bacterium]|nr:hypothetical protein [Oligoflexia bacterium]HMR24386.1 hypothetical protein [Oligoflexia bacterium]
MKLDQHKNFKISECECGGYVLTISMFSMHLDAAKLDSLVHALNAFYLSKMNNKYKTYHKQEHLN